MINAKKHQCKILLACIMGNAIEWYDFFLYAFFATILSQAFFPFNASKTHFLAALLTFAVGYLMRPIGALYFGLIGDSYGRRNTLLQSITLMAIPTIAIGMLPTYKTIGITASILFVSLRLIQGFAISGEYPASTTYLFEISNQTQFNKFLISSLSLSGIALGMLLGAILIAFLSMTVSNKQLHDWGWRIPFLTSAILVPIIKQLRTHLTETYNPSSSNQIVLLFKLHWQGIAKAICLFWFNIVSFYLFLFYIPTYLQSNGLVSHAAVSVTHIASLFLIIVGVIVSTVLIEKSNIKKYLISILVIETFALSSILWVYQNNQAHYFTFLQLLASFAIGLYVGPLPKLCCELFPVTARLFGMAISLNFAAGIIGGTTPLICELISKYADFKIISIYLLISGIMSSIAISKL